jgi:beta-amylase
MDKRTLLFVFLTCLFHFSQLWPRTAFARGGVPVNIMGPLVIGDIGRPEDPRYQAEWQDFERQLAAVRRAGAKAVTTDIWWGAVAKGSDPGSFDWRYYDKLLATIERVGMRWIPILSFHRCGGNVGDACDISIPGWVWQKYGDSVGWVSEYGNASRETVSVWGTEVVAGEYRVFMKAFQSHFAHKSSLVDEINISLGPSGELRFPSYNAHDGAVAGYPSRGALQAYSGLAKESFREWVRNRHATLESLNRAWSSSLRGWSEVGPPMDTQQGFFEKGQHLSPYGKDFFDWYQDSLLGHARRVLKVASEVFDAPASPFLSVDIGAKVPGIHWRVGSDRLAELTAGLLRTSQSNDWNSDREGHGYRSILSAFSSNGLFSNTRRVVLHFTCLEKGNHEGGASVASLAEDLVFWVGAESARQNLRLKGENALEGALGDSAAWGRIRNALQWSHYEGLTLLRLAPLVQAPGALGQLTSLTKAP